MKHRMLAILLFVSTFAATAQHWYGVSAMFNGNRHFDNQEIANNWLGAGGGGGIGYLYQKNMFVLECGIDISYNDYRQGYDNAIHAEYDEQDSQGTAFTHIIDIDARIDHLYLMDLSVPLYLGIETSYMYFLAGIKGSIVLTDKTKQHTMLESKAVYDRFYGVIGDVTVEDYQTKILQQNGRANLKRFNLLPHIEVGAKFGDGRRGKHRFGVFAEFGIMNQLSGAGTVSYLQTTDLQNMTIKMTHIYAAQEANDCYSRNLLFGIRYSFYMPFKQNQPSYPCKCER